MQRLALVLLVFLLGACATATAPGTTTTATAAPLTAQQKLLALATTVDKQCTVALPFLASVVAMQTDSNAISTATDIDNAAIKVCGYATAYVAAPTVSSTFTLASVQTFVNAQVPPILTLVKNSTKLTSVEKTAAEIGVTGAQLIIAQAVANAQ